MAPVRKLWVRGDSHHEFKEVADKLNEVIERLAVLEAGVKR